MISIKTQKEICIMREAGKILAQIIGELKNKVEPGITTKELDELAEAHLLKYKAEPAFKGHEGFPRALCASVNSAVVHSVPCDYKLKQGDILSLDLGIRYRGFFSDMAITLPVTSIGQTYGDFEALRLIRVTKKALQMGIAKIRPGNTVGDIGNTIQRFVEGQGFGVVRDLCGHGIGRNLHEEPSIFNYGKRHKGEKLKQGMVLCLEPMVTAGDWRLVKSADKFGYETKDGSLSAHFEHTIVVTKNGAKVLTKV